MAEYHLLSTWQIEAPLETVYDTIHDSLRWPEWWQGLRTVEQIAPGDPTGIGSRRRYCWRSALPYGVAFEILTTRIEQPSALEGEARGDLEGNGRWRLRHQAPVTVVQFEWHVRTTKWWWKLVEPVARPIFIRNHGWLMTRGAEGLARRLHATLRHEESIELVPPHAPLSVPGRLRQGGRISPLMVLFAGVWAGVIATGAQMVLWWMADRPVLETLLRDARLTAAIVMGPEMLSPPSPAQLDILLIASLIHFALSVSYALIPAGLCDRMSAWSSPLAGALYGLAIYAFNLYGMTAFFPWFAVARDGITLLTHIVFGLAVVGGCRLFARLAKKA